jgi:osmoprotectant transport system permease protein
MDEDGAMSGVLQWLTDPVNWQGPSGVPVRFVEHLGLSAAALGLACLVALPLALWLGHKGKGGTLAINVSNVGRAVPTFALLALLALGAIGFNAVSTVLALTLFGIPPVLTNAYIAMREVDRDVVEAASGMGMDALTMIRRVELPLATPLIVNGVRLAAVQIVATATIAALVGGGGLGRIITSGFGRQDTAALVSGAILVAVFAVAVEGGFALLQRRVDPLRARSRTAPGPGDEAAPAEAEPTAVPGPT